MRTITLLLILLCPSVLYGQIQSSAETKYILSGIDGYENIGDLLLVPSHSKPTLKAVGLVTIDSPASMITVKASTEKRVPVEVKKVSTDRFLVLGLGKIWINVTAIDFDTKLFEQTEFIIDIGIDPVPPTPDPDPPTPDPDPTPNPDPIPPDQFDNIAQRVQSWSVGLQDKSALAALYKDAANKLNTDPSYTISTISAELLTAIQALPSVASYTELRKKINSDISVRSPLSRLAYAKYLELVALGLSQ